MAYMNITSFFKQHSLSFICFVSLALSAFWVSTAGATTIDFSTEPTAIVPLFSSADITVTGSANLDFLNSRGFGVEGGFYNSTLGPMLDQGESLTFTFDPGYVANGILLYNSLLDNPNGGIVFSGLDVTGYDSNGQVTSTAHQYVGGAGAINISGLVGVDLTKFEVTAPVDGIQFWRLDYTLTPVPIPGAFWLLGSGVAGLLAAGRRKK